jgi:hypothetical protein
MIYRFGLYQNTFQLLISHTKLINFKEQGIIFCQESLFKMNKSIFKIFFKLNQYSDAYYLLFRDLK